MKSLIAILLFACTSIYVNCNMALWEGNMYSYDVKGYYEYLPALFVNHDLKNVYLFPNDSSVHRYDKYPLGVAFFELPLFLVAHAYCNITHSFDANGYTTPYQLAGIGSTILWVVLGLFMLRKFLKQYYSDWVVAIALVCISFGTNLYTYTVFDPGMSHPFSFFLFSTILYCSARWYQKPDNRYIYLLGILLGWVVITRPTNCIIAILPLFWGVYNRSSAAEKFRLLAAHKNQLLGAFVLFMLVCFIQLTYWKYRQGQWLFYSYGNEGFDFSHPKIIDGLFSFRKGWFVYTPMAAIGMIGLAALWRKNRKLVPALMIYFVLAIYLIFCWQNWWYGGGFSCRPLIESLSVLALPLGALIEYTLKFKKVIATSLFGLILVAVITLNIFQSFQFQKGILHCERMTREAYVYIFFKTKIDYDKIGNYLMTDQQYWQATSGLNP